MPSKCGQHIAPWMWPHRVACTGLHNKSARGHVLVLPSPALFQLGSAVIHSVTEVVLLHTNSSCLWSKSDTWWYFNKLKHCRLLLPLASSPLSPHLSREDNILSFTCSSYCLHNLWGTLTQSAPVILLYRKENKKETLCTKRKNRALPLLSIRLSFCRSFLSEGDVWPGSDATCVCMDLRATV